MPTSYITHGKHFTHCKYETVRHWCNQFSGHKISLYRCTQTVHIRFDLADMFRLYDSYFHPTIFKRFTVVFSSLLNVIDNVKNTLSRPPQSKSPSHIQSFGMHFCVTLHWNWPSLQGFKFMHSSGSSDPSSQSIFVSHFQLLGMHWPFLHRKWLGEHVASEINFILGKLMRLWRYKQNFDLAREAIIF